MPQARKGRFMDESREKKEQDFQVGLVYFPVSEEIPFGDDARLWITVEGTRPMRCGEGRRFHGRMRDGNR